MEPSLGQQKVNPSNYDPPPRNDGTKSIEPRTESKQPGTLTSQLWNQVEGSRKWIQATRNLPQATLAPSWGNQKVNPGNQEPPGNHGTKSRETETDPGNLEASPDNHRTKVNESRSREPSTGTMETIPGNQGTKSREPGSESRQPEFFRQPWNQVLGTRKWVQTTRLLHQATMEPIVGNQEMNPVNQEPSLGNHGSKPRDPGSESRQPETFTRLFLHLRLHEKFPLEILWTQYWRVWQPTSQKV